MSRLDKLVVSPNTCIREVLKCIDFGAQGIALVVDDQQRLISTITDGDARRAILAGINLDLPVQELLVQRDANRAHGPVTAPHTTSQAELLHLMNEKTLRQIPLVDEEGRVVDVAFLSELAKEYELPLRALVMAGGYGTRLRPLTDDMPKPMLPVGDRPLLEIIVDGLREAGIKQVNVATHYKAEVIANHFKDGQKFGVDIRYVKEDEPLGTAGALSLLDESEEPLLVINGDILTRVDFRSMLNFHKEQKADLTVAVRQYEFNVPYGVILTDGVNVKGIAEKPVVKQFINAGIYLLSPAVRKFVPNGKAYDIPDLIEWLIEDQRPVVCFPIREYWLDIGKADHYAQAKSDMANGRF
jgi:dTDP-glucose pyrophosphorylase